MRFNPDSPDSVAETMRHLIEARRVGMDEAKALNLTDVDRSGDTVSSASGGRAAGRCP
jgi:hypothetical protein